MHFFEVSDPFQPCITCKDPGSPAPRDISEVFECPATSSPTIHGAFQAGEICEVSEQLEFWFWGRIPGSWLYVRKRNLSCINLVPQNGDWVSSTAVLLQNDYFRVVLRYRGERGSR